MADDALSEIPVPLAWGGRREKQWHRVGKRAVVHVDPVAYGVVSVLARLCNRPLNGLNKQIYAAGLVALLGQDLETICRSTATVAPAPGVPPLRVAKTDDEVKAMAARIVLAPVAEA